MSIDNQVSTLMEGFILYGLFLAQVRHQISEFKSLFCTQGKSTKRSWVRARDATPFYSQVQMMNLCVSAFKVLGF